MGGRMEAEELLSPDRIRDDVKRIFNAVVDNCGDVRLVVDYVPFGGEAGGDTTGSGDSDDKVVRVLTVPQLSGVWQKVFDWFIDPWTKFKYIKAYIDKNDLWKYINADDCDTKTQVWMEFEDRLVQWGYNEVMNAALKLIKKYHLEGEKEKKKVPKIVKKPLHKNKPFVGGLGITIAGEIILFLHQHLPAGIATMLSGVVVMVLSLLEHKNLYEIKKELERVE